jgi:hypothetical protein
MRKFIIAYYTSLNLLAISKSSLEVDLFRSIPHVLALVPPNLTHYSTHNYSAASLRTSRAATYRYRPDQTLEENVRQQR